MKYNFHSLETYFRMREKAGADIDAIFKAAEQKKSGPGVLPRWK